MPTTGMETRAQMDTEGVRGLLYMNGGGVVALLAFLAQVIAKPELGPLTIWVLWAMLSYQIGLVAAIVHNRLRRKCSLEYEKAGVGSPQGTGPCDKRWLAWVSEDEPCVCCRSIIFHWTSLGAFMLGGVLVFVGGLRVIGKW
jgi:hypothetical protein